VLGAVSLLFFVATHALFSQNTNVPDWGVPAQVKPGLEPNSAPRAYTLYLGWLGDAEDVGRLDEFRTGMMPRIRETATVNGYTPIGHRFGSEFLCMNIFGETCPELGPRVLLPNPFTGVPYADLLRIERLIVMKGPHLDLLRRALTPEWRLEFDGPYTQRFVRDLPNAALPGTVSWVSPGTAVEAEGPARSMAEQVRVTRSGERPTTIIFARLWWPGYQAEFGGDTLPVRAHRGIFVKVNVPAGPAEGVLTLRFQPPRLALGIAGAAGGLAIILVVLAFPGLGAFRGRRGSAVGKVSAASGA
jgi:hypothetical protein